MANIPGPAEVSGAHVRVDLVDALEQTDALAHHLARRRGRADIQRVPAAKLDRVEVQLPGQRIHVAFRRKTTLCDAKAPERASGHVVRIGGIAVDFDVGDFVRAGRVRRRPGQHLVTQAGVCTAVPIQDRLDGGQFAVRGRAGSHPNDGCMPLRMNEQAFLPRIEHLYGLLCRLGEQRRVNLSSDVFLAAEASAHERCNDTYILGFDTQ